MISRFAIALVFALPGLSATSAGAMSITPILDESTEGNNNNLIPFDDLSVYRYQQIWDGSLFGVTPVSLTSISFRFDVIQSENLAATQLDLSLSLSTTSARVDGLSSDPSANVGSDATVVSVDPTISGTVGGSPNPFNVTITFSTAFLFDPTAGNLLLDIVIDNYVNIGGDANVIFDAQFNITDGTSRLISDINGINRDSAGLVVQFGTAPIDPVPLPAGIWLGLTGLAGLGLLKRRRRV